MLVSIIIPAYNRAHTIGRAIESILQQSHTDFEIIVVDDGSTDNLTSAIRQYRDKRIRLFSHEGNKGVNAAKNTGFNNMRGEWFTILDSDDEMVVPGALSGFVTIIQNNPEVTAITCNCIDTSTNEFSGKGLDSDQYLDWKTIIQKCRGEFWGLTKTELLGNKRLNERLWGQEDVLWYKINKLAKRYYIHNALRIYHTEGNDRVSSHEIDDSASQKKYESYVEIFRETEYISDLKEFGEEAFRDMCFSASLTFVAFGDKRNALASWLQLAKTKNSFLKCSIITLGLLFGRDVLFFLRKFKKQHLTFTPQ